jgi:hypothetical protein
MGSNRRYRRIIASHCKRHSVHMCLRLSLSLSLSLSPSLCVYCVYPESGKEEEEEEEEEEEVEHAIISESNLRFWKAHREQRIRSAPGSFSPCPSRGFAIFSNSSCSSAQRCVCLSLRTRSLDIFFSNSPLATSRRNAYECTSSAHLLARVIRAYCSCTAVTACT